jgi:hypothetical protein
MSYECLPPLGFTRHITNCRQTTEFLLLSLFSSVGSWTKIEKKKIGDRYNNIQKIVRTRRRRRNGYFI